MSFTYNKDEKLKSQKAISELFTVGKSISAYPLMMVYMKNDNGLKVSVSVSKKRFKKAVDRNRIKRLLREGYRLNKSVLIDNSVQNHSFILIYIGKELPDFQLINSKVTTIFSKFIAKATKKN